MAVNLTNLKIYLKITDTVEDDLLSLLLAQADAKILQKRFPFDATDEEKALALTAYSDVELDIAVYLYNKQGAEGEKAHNENGMNRSYESASIPPSYTSGITPMCGVV